MLEEAGFTVPRTDKGSYCTAVGALRDAGIDHEAVDYLSMLNQARGLPDASLAVVADDGRVHPSVQASQASGRLSIKKPALTTFGADDKRNLTDRDLFVAADGHLLLAVRPQRHRRARHGLALEGPGHDRTPATGQGLAHRDGRDRLRRPVDAEGGQAAVALGQLLERPEHPGRERRGDLRGGRRPDPAVGRDLPRAG